jgi:hypothetical protein
MTGLTRLPRISVDVLPPPLHAVLRLSGASVSRPRETDVKRTAITDQRRSLGCAHLDSLAVRPAYLRNRFASRGSASM